MPGHQRALRIIDRGRALVGDAAARRYRHRLMEMHTPFTPRVIADPPVGTNGSRPRIVNAMTVDVEEHFQVSAFEHHVARDHWDSFESRVCRNTERLLALFEGAGVTASFF